MKKLFVLVLIVVFSCNPEKGWTRIIEIEEKDPSTIQTPIEMSDPFKKIDDLQKKVKVVDEFLSIEELLFLSEDRKPHGHGDLDLDQISGLLFLS